jgi:crotonobetainyl-CoA:carnitine CoA-transferase CaiB-like acyl-CoA transferase
MRHAHLLPLVFALGCGGASFVDKAHHSLATALVATNQARDAFALYDLEHQKVLVEAAADDPAVATASVKAYREKRAPVLTAFTVAYSAIAAAATGLAAAKTQKEKLDVTALIADAVSATMDVKQALSALVEKKASP